MSDLSHIDFDDIRPYTDKEVKSKIALMVKDPVFDEVLLHVFKFRPVIEMVKLQLRMIRTIKQLQGTFIYDLLRTVINKSSDGLTCSGIESLDKKKPYLFISNHRDIVLDAALLNFLIFEKGMNTTLVAIGNNLMLYNWIEHAVKLNRAFVIKRNLPPREIHEASLKVSHFIRKSIVEDKLSVWIAQREGRTKDGNDKTQPALLKMLNLSNIKEFAEGFKELRIVPLSISYEIEPCGISKVAEIYKRQTEGFEKTQDDDLRSMGEGLVRPKGRVHFGFGNPVTCQIDFCDNEETISGKIDKLAEQLDQQIYSNFQLWPNNYIAEDILNHTSQNVEYYTPEQFNQFVIMVDEAVSLIPGDPEITRRMFLQMYVNPLLNKRKSMT